VRRYPILARSAAVLLLGALPLLGSAASAAIVYEFSGIVETCNRCLLNIGDTFSARIGFLDGTDTSAGATFDESDLELVELQAPFPDIVLVPAFGGASGTFGATPQDLVFGIGSNFQGTTFGFNAGLAVPWQVATGLGGGSPPPFREATGTVFTVQLPEPGAGALLALGMVALGPTLGPRRRR